MSKDPWKKAYQQSQLKTKQAEPGSRARRPSKSRRNVAAIISIALLVLVIGAGAFAWMNRDWWIPRYREQMPDVVREQVKEPRADVDWDKLEQGLGLELRMLGEYDDLIRATRDNGIEWALTQEGAQSFRMTTDGVKVYVQSNLIENYELDLTEIFRKDVESEWRIALDEAGFSPDLTYTALTGADDMPMGSSEWEYTSPVSREAFGMWVKPAFKLYFYDGWLRRIKGVYVTGPASEDDEVVSAG